MIIFSLNLKVADWIKLLVSDFIQLSVYGQRPAARANISTITSFLFVFSLWIGVRIGDNGLEYLVKWVGDNQLQCMTAEEAIRKIPVPIILFLETKITWFTPDHVSEILDRQPPTQSENVVGNPIDIHCKYFYSEQIHQLEQLIKL